MSSPEQLEDLHPSLWRASQLGRSVTRCVDTGFPSLSNQLVGNGWPTGTLIELLVQQPGVGEMRLLAPALAKVANRQIFMIQPPHPPQIMALAGLGIEPTNVLWVKSRTSADALWATEQVLRSGSVGGVLLWAPQIRPESLRRLHLSAGAGETLLWLLRPLSAAQDPSPSPLRLSVRPARGGITVEFVKRRGPIRDELLFLPLDGHLVRPHRSTPRETLPVNEHSSKPEALEAFVDR